MTEFYVIYRYTKVTHILKLLFRQFFFFFLYSYAFIGFFKQPNMSRFGVGSICDLCLFSNFSLEILQLLLVDEVQGKCKRNIRNVVVIGKNKKTQQLIDVFNESTEYGYQFRKQFCPKEKGFDLEIALVSLFKII